MRPPADAHPSDSAVPPILRPQTDWHTLFFYRKALVLHRLIAVFTRRFLPAHGDRTVDQMVQAARSGKQNIVEGFAAGVTSTGTELKLLNVARGSAIRARTGNGRVSSTNSCVFPAWRSFPCRRRPPTVMPDSSVICAARDAKSRTTTCGLPPKPSNSAPCS